MDRMDKINQFFKREISNMLLVGEIKDPRVRSVTITFVDVSKDLSWAHVGFSILSDDPKDLRDAQAGLDSARGAVRRLLGQRVTLRHIPEVKFVHDNSIAQSVHMSRMFDELQRERALRGGAPTGEAGEGEPRGEAAP